MALEKTVKNDQIEVIDMDNWKVVQVRTATIIKDEGAEVSRSYHRHTVYPLDDWSNESADVKSICDAMHTDSAKEAYRAYLETDPLS